jgi:two-component system OmpR family response regulator
LLDQRRRTLARGMLWCDELAINLVEREVHRDGQLISMPMREFGLIARLAMSPNQPVSRHDLLRAVWRIDFDPGTNRIDVHVSRLRRRIDDGHAHAMLRTVKGMGYALVSREGAAMFA